MKLHFNPLLLCLMLVSAIAFAQKPVSDKQAAQDIDNLLKERFRADEPGLAVLVTHNGKTVMRNGYGLHDVEKKKSNEAESIFRIGSITKQFTSTAILLLAQEGKLSLDDDITKFLPQYPTHGKKITIEHLLTHTSGIKSYTSLPEIMNKETKKQSFTVNGLISTFQDKPMDFEPGEQYEYNNSGYVLLGAIIEKVSGVTWGNYLQKNFFTPLKMTSTFTTDPKKDIVAKGYQKDAGGKFELADYVDPSLPYAAGAIFSTVGDLEKWNTAIFNNKIVKQQWLNKAWTPLKLNNGHQESYGYGWQLGRVDQHFVIGHGGGIDGFASFEMFIPDEKIYICVLINRTDVVAEDLAYKVADQALGRVNDQPIIAIDEKVLDHYTGVYTIKNESDRFITRDGIKLFSQRTGGTKFEIFPIAADEFVFKNTSSHLKFKRDEKGSVISATLIARDFILQEAIKTDRPIPKERAIVTLQPNQFDSNVGQYALAPDFIITISRIDDKFFAQATGQLAFEIFPESSTKFFTRVVDAQIEFIKDESGKVNEMKLYQGGQIMPGKRVEGKTQPARQAITLSSAALQQYAGNYELAPGVMITVRNEGQKITAQITNQPAAEIFPESDTNFFYKIVDAQIVFSKDAQGKVTMLTLHQAGKVLPAPKR